MRLNEKQVQALQEIGETIERVQNICGSLQLPIPNELHVKAIRESLPEIELELKEKYEIIMNEKIWSNHE